MRFNYLPSVLLAAALLSIAPNAEAQNKITAQDMPQQWQNTLGFDQGQESAASWWTVFNDPMLDSLMSLGISNNYDVLNAKHRIEIASQTIRQAQAQYYPTLGVNAGWTRQRSSGMTTEHTIDASTISYFDLGANLSWQIDVFGKINAQTKQSKAGYKATRAQYDAMMLTISGKIATAYMQLRMLQAEKKVLDQHISQQKRVSEITQARHEAGLASMLDVTQSLTTYYSTLASETSLETSITTTINALAILTGCFPEDITPMLTTVRPMPDYHQLISVGTPIDLLRRRPDIIAAEYALASDAAALGIAKKDFLPTLTLNGSIGTMAHDASDLMAKRSITYSIAPTLSWTVFDGMARKAAVASAKEQMQISIDNYNSAVLTAIQEIDNAMSSYYNSLQYIDVVSQIVEYSKKSFDLSIDLYKQGLTAFINVTDAQIAYLQYSNELVSAQGQALAAAVNLYQALGGSDK